MGWTPPPLNGIYVPKLGREATHLNRSESVHHEDYDSRDRLGEERLPGTRRKRARQGCAEEATEAASGARVFRKFAAMLDWDGGLWRRPLLGSQAPGTRPY